MGTWEDALEVDKHPEGGWQTESREETRGTWSRTCPAGPRFIREPPGSQGKTQDQDPPLGWTWEPKPTQGWMWEQA